MGKQQNQLVTHRSFKRLFHIISIFLMGKYQVKFDFLMGIRLPFLLVFNVVKHNDFTLCLMLIYLMLNSSLVAICCTFSTLSMFTQMGSKLEPHTQDGVWSVRRIATLPVQHQSDIWEDISCLIIYLWQPGQL